jgi:hypothetical protein
MKSLLRKQKYNLVFFLLKITIICYCCKSKNRVVLNHKSKETPQDEKNDVKSKETIQIKLNISPEESLEESPEESPEESNDVNWGWFIDFDTDLKPVNI